MKSNIIGSQKGGKIVKRLLPLVLMTISLLTAGFASKMKRISKIFFNF